MSQFDFLKKKFPKIYHDAVKSERRILNDPRASGFYASLALEKIIDWLFKHDPSMTEAYAYIEKRKKNEKDFKPNLKFKSNNPYLKKLMGGSGSILYMQVKYIRNIGETSNHHSTPPNSTSAKNCVHNLLQITLWFHKKYCTDQQSSTISITKEEEFLENPNSQFTFLKKDFLNIYKEAQYVEDKKNSPNLRLKSAIEILENITDWLYTHEEKLTPAFQNFENKALNNKNFIITFYDKISPPEFKEFVGPKIFQAIERINNYASKDISITSKEADFILKDLLYITYWFAPNPSDYDATNNPSEDHTILIDKYYLENLKTENRYLRRKILEIEKILKSL